MTRQRIAALADKATPNHLTGLPSTNASCANCGHGEADHGTFVLFPGACRYCACMTFVVAGVGR